MRAVRDSWGSRGAWSGRRGHLCGNPPKRVPRAGRCVHPEEATLAGLPACAPCRRTRGARTVRAPAPPGGAPRCGGAIPEATLRGAVQPARARALLCLLGVSWVPLWRTRFTGHCVCKVLGELISKKPAPFRLRWSPSPGCRDLSPWRPKGRGC